MGRPKLARHPKPEPVEETPQEEPEFALDGKPKPAISKAEAVRQGLARGIDDLDDLDAFVKSEYGLEIPRPMLSAYRAQVRAKERKAEGGEAAPRRRSAPTQQATIPSTLGSDLKELRTLIERLGGADNAKDLIGQIAGLRGRYGDQLPDMIDAVS